VRLAPKLAMAVVLALGAGCTSQATTTAAVSGAGDTAVYQQLRNTATLELTLFTENQAFTDDLAKLATVDGSLRLGPGLAPPAGPGIVNVAVSADAQWACLTGTSSLGHVLVMAIGPKTDVYSGTAALADCSASGAQGLRPANG
jgi:hypothetical protein